MADLETSLRKLLPGGVRWECGPGYVFVHRESLPDPDPLLAEVLKAVRAAVGLRTAVLDWHPEGLAEANLVPTGHPETRPYRRVPGLTPPDGAALEAEERERRVLAPYAKRLPGLAVFHVDHHYPHPLLTFTTTTMLVMDFLRYLHRAGAEERVAELQAGFAVVEHADADIVLAHYALARGGEMNWLRREAVLLRDVSLRNDYVVWPRKGVRRKAAAALFDFCVDLEERLRGGDLSWPEGFAELDRALGVIHRGRAASPADRAWFRQRRRAGERRREVSRRVLRGLQGRYRAEPAPPATLREARLEPGSLVAFGPVLCVYPAEPVDLESSEVVALLEEGFLPERPRAVVTATHRQGGWLIRMRAVPGPEGLLDLTPVYAALARHPRWAALRPGGRPGAGGLGKGPRPDLPVGAALYDVAAAIFREAARPGPPVPPPRPDRRSPRG